MQKNNKSIGFIYLLKSFWSFFLQEVPQIPVLIPHLHRSIIVIYPECLEEHCADAFLQERDSLEILLNVCRLR